METRKFGNRMSVNRSIRNKIDRFHCVNFPPGENRRRLDKKSSNDFARIFPEPPESYDKSRIDPLLPARLDVSPSAIRMFSSSSLINSVNVRCSHKNNEIRLYIASATCHPCRVGDTKKWSFGFCLIKATNNEPHQMLWPKLCSPFMLFYAFFMLSLFFFSTGAIPALTSRVAGHWKKSFLPLFHH